MDDLQTLVERQRIVDVLVDLFVATDRRDWAAVRACLADEVLFDMSSLGGPPPARIPGADIAASWEKGLAALTAIHHQAGNFRVWPRDGDADASCYGIALHYRPNPSGRNTRTFVGSYEFGLRKDGARWRIDRFRFLAKWIEGNLELERS